MSEVLMYGFLTGMVMSFMLGTVFFALVQNSIDYGFRTGVFISLGVITSDLILIVLSWFNAELIPQGSTTDLIVRICGAVFLLLYGFSNLLKKEKAAYPKTEKKQLAKFMSMGFLLNILNPGNYIGWLAVTTQLKTVARYEVTEAALYFAGAIGAIFLMECLIAWSASFLKPYITDRFLQLVNRLIGVLFIAFAIALFFY
ncbi:MAG: LysE family translocator [Crocinitomicaceae bacterium]|jgi:threonine/homoserine/homoserine lactone efflux protein|nr:LysE family translocator [Crocinitomicaceae bacterium]MDP4723799.1 LysE family translocator [Crocinitomicaceae bacterium]MDP4739440.1 LysE family translocator [Crocinitomicaceae bacterium]MDP4805959.1 LysE family translocator [Crocinitomicaceae bacterium]MDP4867913.1 LysE family translocator [Crocinitomicaceae bacterium]